MCTTCGYNMYGCRHQLYLAANTNFSPILEILLANGCAWGSWSEDWTSFVCGGDEDRGRGGLLRNRQHTHTHKVTPHSAHGCKISNIHGMASCHTPDRSITRMRASLVCAQPRVAIDPRAERAISRIGVPGPRSGSETWSEGVYRVIGANRLQLLSRYKD